MPLLPLGMIVSLFFSLVHQLVGSHWGLWMMPLDLDLPVFRQLFPVRAQQEGPEAAVHQSVD